MGGWKAIAPLLQGSLSSGLPPEEITEALVFQIADSLADRFTKKVGKPDRQVLEGFCPDSFIWILSQSLWNFIILVNWEILRK